ncbi:rhomboid domain-containing protein 3 [Alligator sinensis]|uniref:Rhomboid domain-containing protein 3 n=1 Tax=Alligator sinensis TaxID=38654 RepID=A0A1U7RQ39_ALLSI|nr:rhomboid domain-containing protein 3 [Alligator sinensis]
MLIRRPLSLRWGLEPPPFASVTLMLLLCFLWLAGVCESLSLKPALLLQHFQVYRLVTYCLCHTDPSLLLLNLLLFPLLAWPQERYQGTLRYLHAALLSAFASALVYLILVGLWAAHPGPACSYTPVHLAMLGRHQAWRTRVRGWGQVAMAALPLLLLVVSQLLLPGSPWLLHLSGAVVGLAYWSGAFSRLELSERHLEALQDAVVCRVLARRGFIRFILSPGQGILPMSNLGSSRDSSPGPSVSPAWQLYPGSPLDQSTAAPGPPRATEWPRVWQDSRLLHTSVPLSHFLDLYRLPPPWVVPIQHPQASVGEALLDEQMLQAGIQASLQDTGLEAAMGEVKLSKSSVSSLRLQQLERMGFQTEEAVVALAATGRVEGAVSLLVGGQVGDEATVMSENRLAHHEPLQPTAHHHTME